MPQCEDDAQQSPDGVLQYSILDLFAHRPNALKAAEGGDANYDIRQTGMERETSVSVYVFIAQSAFRQFNSASKWLCHGAGVSIEKNTTSTVLFLTLRLLFFQSRRPVEPHP